MKPTTKHKLIKAIGIAVQALEIKCGGVGGTPGPCPMGGGAKPAAASGGAKPPAAGKPVKAKSPPDPIESGSEDKNLSAEQVMQFAAGLKKGMKVRLHMKYKTPDKDFAENPQDYPKGYDGVHTTQTAIVQAVKKSASEKNGVEVRVRFGHVDEGYGAGSDLMSHPVTDAMSWTYKAEVVND